MNAPFQTQGMSIVQADLSDGGDVDRLEELVEDNQGSLFHRPAWLRAVEMGTGQEAMGLVAQRGGTIVGWLPLTLCHSPLFGRALISSGFGVGGGVLSEHASAARALCEHAQQQAQRMSCDAIELRGGVGAPGWTIIADSHCGFVSDLAEDDDAQLLAIPRKQRAEDTQEPEAGFRCKHRFVEGRLGPPITISMRKASITLERRCFRAACSMRCAKHSPTIPTF